MSNGDLFPANSASSRTLAGALAFFENRFELGDRIEVFRTAGGALDDNKLLN